jgi:hypothetical protein
MLWLRRKAVVSAASVINNNTLEDKSADQTSARVLPRPTIEDAVIAEDTEICRSNEGGNMPTCQVCFKYDHDALSCRNRFNHSYKADDGREHHANAANT